MRKEGRISEIKRRWSGYELSVSAVCRLIILHVIVIFQYLVFSIFTNLTLHATGNSTFSRGHIRGPKALSALDSCIDARTLVRQGLGASIRLYYYVEGERRNRSG